MEHIYPAFERGRILKKELLWALRDYSYSALQLQYREYPDGILSGCSIRTEGSGVLWIGQGIIKCQGFIFLITGEEQVMYAPTDRYTSLKFRVEAKEELADYTRYTTDFVLDKSLERQPNEIEICRFKLKEGARLRTDYKDFFDIQTEFDTVNLADATWSAAGGNTLSKEVTDCFARKVLECGSAQDSDAQFAYLLLQGKEAVRREVLEDYITRKTGRAAGHRSQQELFHALEAALDDIRRGSDMRRPERRGLEQRMIVLD